jgi:hypothetical protein
VKLGGSIEEDSSGEASSGAASNGEEASSDIEY